MMSFHLSLSVHCRCVFQQAQTFQALAVSWAEAAELLGQDLHTRDTRLQVYARGVLQCPSSLRDAFVAAAQLAHVWRPPEPQQLAATGHLARFLKKKTKTTNY